MQNRVTKIVLMIIFLGTIVVIFAMDKDPAKDRQVIKIGYNSQSINYGPVMVGIEKGFFQNNEYDLDFISLKSGKEIRQTIATGQLDLGMTSATNFFTIISVGAPVKIIAPVTTTKVLLFVRPDNEIQTFEDLRGKTIQGGKIGQSEAVFINALKKEGINVSEIKFRDIEKEYRGMALINQKIIDAIPGSSYNEEGYDDFGVIIHREWIEKGYGYQYWPNTVLAANTDFLENNGDVAEFIIKGLIKSQKFIYENPDESAKMISNHINRESLETAEFSPEEVLNAWANGLNYSLWYDPSLLVNMAQLTFENGVLEKNLTKEDMLDLRFELILKESQDEIYS